VHCPILREDARRAPRANSCGREGGMGGDKGLPAAAAAEGLSESEKEEGATALIMS